MDTIPVIPMYSYRTQLHGKISVACFKYTGPTSSKILSWSSFNCMEDYAALVEKLEHMGSMIAIHLDDCQEFYCGKIRECVVNDTIKVCDAMLFALRIFSNIIASFKQSNKITWIFSGTRPNLLSELTVASGMRTMIISTIQDLKCNDIVAILSNYFHLPTDHSQEFLSNCDRLTGPPKIISFFLSASQNFHLKSFMELMGKWKDIEDFAIGSYSNQITTTIKFFKGKFDMGMYARNLCLLHTYSLFQNTAGMFFFDDLPASWMPFIEAGLIRVIKTTRKWQLLPPNRFLVEIFQGFVKWFSWENIHKLVTNIDASSITSTLNGKVFECLFALEVCGLPDNSVWQRIAHQMGLQQLRDWVPLFETMNHIDDCTDRNCVYVIIDPDRTDSKSDVVFYAREIESDKTVRVLCQLTIQKSNSTQKTHEAFSAMLKRYPNDYKLFLCPKSNIKITGVYANNYQFNKCYWNDASSFGDMLEFSLDLCNPKKTTESLQTLMEFAISLKDRKLADKIEIHIPKSSSKQHSPDTPSRKPRCGMPGCLHEVYFNSSGIASGTFKLLTKALLCYLHKLNVAKGPKPPVKSSCVSSSHRPCAYCRCLCLNGTCNNKRNGTPKTTISYI
jgi:hypothetical protein